MKKIYFLMVVFSTAFCNGQAMPPINESCGYNSFWTNYDAMCHQGYALRSIWNDDSGSVTDSLYVRGTNSYGQLKTIPPLRKHFSLTNTGLGGSASYDNNTGIINVPVIPSNTNQLTNGAGFITASSSNALTNKTGNISMWTNNAGYLTAASAKIPVAYTGNTNASGVFTVTYPVAYGTVPNVQAIFTTTDPRDVIMLTSSTVSGCSFLVQRRADVIGLLPTYSNRASVPVNVLVTPY